MDNQFTCQNQGRRKAVKSPKDTDGKTIAPFLNGIDYLEVKPADQTRLIVYFLHPLPGQPNPVPPSPNLTVENIRIEGGGRIKNIKVETIDPNNNILTVTVNQAGDFSPYTLRIVASPTETKPPDGFDPQLSAVQFSFKAGCPGDFDCKSDTLCPPEKLTEPQIDYLARDYASFRRLMLDRLSIIMPNWQERNPSDLQVSLVELLAYTGDYLSYYQDSVATESYLGIARRRVSARRHARLLDYPVHDGCNARAWVCFDVKQGGASENQPMKAGTMLLTRDPDGNSNAAVTSLKLEEAMTQRPQVFETKHDITLHSAHNKISFYTWSDSQCCLPGGSTRATLKKNPNLSLEAGDILIFEEILSPTTGLAADIDLTHRHAVRLKSVETDVDPLTTNPVVEVVEIEWFEEDALPFPLCLTAIVPGAGAGNSPGEREISIARGNAVLADHGQTLTHQVPDPAFAPQTGDYRPRLKHGGITHAVSYKDNDARLIAAADALKQDPRKALPAVKLETADNSEPWTPRRDLLGSDRFAAEMVVETERDGRATIRFGDDVSGKKPAAGFQPLGTYRIGSGRGGNAGAEAIGRVVWDPGGIDGVRNPMPATGGTDAETLEEVRQFAPQAFRTQERAVTPADYAAKTQLHTGVQTAAASFRWTGSWYTVFITVDRKGGLEVDDAFETEIRNHLEQYRMAGYDLEINGPVFVALDVGLTLCVKPGYFQAHVKEELAREFGRFRLADGRQGFFHPDNFTFGRPVYLSALVERAMDIAGVASVEAHRFHRLGKTPAREKKDGLLQPSQLEVIRLDNDPSFPENGKIEFRVYGGL